MLRAALFTTVERGKSARVQQPVNKSTVVYPYSGILFSVSPGMDRPPKQYAK